MTDTELLDWLIAHEAYVNESMFGYSVWMIVGRDEHERLSDYLVTPRSAIINAIEKVQSGI